MASILPFSPRQGAAAKLPAGRADRPAAIIIFPGVRYERRAEAGPTGTGEAGGGGRRRKRGTAK